MELRPLAADEVECVDAVLPLNRLDTAQTYLVAWDGGEPVGHAHLAWEGTHLGLPELQDVYVLPARRREGIAAALSRAAEHEARGRGHGRISLSVSETGNPDARRLYERLGYVDAGVDRVRVQGTITLRGAPFEVDDTLLYLVKDIGRRVYQHPLAYLLGLEGMALLRAFAGEHDRDFVLARFDEIRKLLDSDGWGDGIHATPMSFQEGYAEWAPYYDEPGNALLELEQPVVWEILDGLPVGVAVDAACGTGRHAARLASLGHRVIGVDATPEMLEVARRKLPEAEFHEAHLHDLPLDDDSADVVVCGIAVSHVPELAPVLAEFARVLRPGGHLVLSDSRGHFADIGLPHVRKRSDGTYGYMPAWARLASDYLAAALPLGLQVRRCEELRRGHAVVGADGTDLYDGSPSPPHVAGEQPVIWSLHPYAVEATNAAWDGRPAAIVWHFQLEPA